MALKHTKKMVLIDPRELERIHTTVKDHDLTGSSVRNMDVDMKKILERPDLSMHDKMQLYHQTLQRYLRVDKQRGKESLNITLTSENKKHKHPEGDDIDSDNTSAIHQEPNSDDIVEVELLDTVPASFETKAKTLLSNLKRNKTKGILNWTPEGEIIVSGNRIQGSNLVDLIHDSLRKRKGYKEPLGWELFNEALALNNTPESLITNTARRNAMRELKSKDTDRPTPKRKRTSRAGKHRQPSPYRTTWELY